MNQYLTPDEVGRRIEATDEAAEAVARGMFGPGWDQQPADAKAVCLRMARKSLEAALPHLAVLEASKPTVVDREAAREQIKSGLLPTLEPMIRYLNRGVSFAEQSAAVAGRADQATEDVLAALYPKATEGKS